MTTDHRVEAVKRLDASDYQRQQGDRSRTPPCDSCSCPTWGLECAEHRTSVQDSPQHSDPGHGHPYRPARGDAVEAWLKAQRDQRLDQYGPTPGWYALDQALNRYRLHADSGTPLTERLDADAPF